jgi:hypothetical protein
MATMDEKDKLSVEEMRKGELGLERKRRGENHALKHPANAIGTQQQAQASEATPLKSTNPRRIVRNDCRR